MVLIGLILSLVSNPAHAASSPKAQANVLWDQWYTILVKRGNSHYSYYHELVERTKGRIHFQNDVWKKEEDYINRESLGAFAEDNDSLSPLFYNYRATFRSTETVIDGNVEIVDGSKFFVAKARSKGADLPDVKKSLNRKAFFEVFFPVWLGKHLAEMKEGHGVSFSTIMEDDLEHDFQLEEGTARLEKPDAIATQTHTHKISVTYRSMPSIWWITDKGYAERIEMPAQELIIERVPREKAESFFTDGGTPSKPDAAPDNE
ncbi:MAG: hypothetical protein P4M08_08665 [Oligoflexia bacterium]|nr:hypothetical protein [Oligoflexia bacterium]